MGRSESRQGCKKHENEKQLPGVCSACLRERLSQLPASSYSDRIGGGYSGASPLSFSPPYSAASSSTFVSPVYRRHHHRASEKTGSVSVSFRLKVGTELNKSRSAAFVARSRGEEVGGSGKKKGGFWSKLLGLQGGGRKMV